MKPLRVLFDDIFLVSSSSGIARLWKSVFQSWSNEVDALQQGIEIVILNRSGQLADLGFKTIDFGARTIGDPFPALDRELLTKVCDELEVDVFVSSYYTFPLRTKSLAFVYDLIPEEFGFSLSHRSWMERVLPLYAASRFVAISESTKRDLSRHYPWIRPDQVDVAVPGVDQKVFTRATDNDVSRFRAKYRLHRPYVMLSGARWSQEHYKNAKVLFKLVETGQLADLDIVATGGEPLQEYEIQTCMRAGVGLRRFEFDDADLVRCLSGAEVLIYPSLYEGFGLPPLEALAVGTPVITTLTSSLPESVGSLTLPLVSNDEAELAIRISEARNVEWQHKIRLRGPQWASRFKWSLTAEATINALLALRNHNDSADVFQTRSVLSQYNERAICLQR